MKGGVAIGEWLYIALILFFSYTLTHKIVGYEAFTMNLIKTSIYPPQYIDVVAVGAIGVEAVAILLLIVSKSLGLRYSLGMMLVFTAYIIALYYHGRYEVCGCGGVLNGLAFGWHLLINVGLILTLAYLKYQDAKH